MVPLIWLRLCQQKKKYSVKLNFHGSVHPYVVRTGAEVLVLERVPVPGRHVFQFSPFLGVLAQQVCLFLVICVAVGVLLGDLRTCTDEHPQSPKIWLAFDTCMDGGREWVRTMRGEGLVRAEGVWMSKACAVVVARGFILVVVGWDRRYGGAGIPQGRRVYPDICFTIEMTISLLTGGAFLFVLLRLQGTKRAAMRVPIFLGHAVLGLKAPLISTLSPPALIKNKTNKQKKKT